MQMNGIFGGLYVITEWMTRLVLTNIIWLFFNIPVIFFGINLFIAETIGERIFFISSMIILLPIFFFPATMAMFSLIRRWVLGEDDIKVLRAYWMHYRENYVRSMAGGFVLVIIWAILLIDYYYFTNNISDWLKYPFFALFFFLSIVNIHFFSNHVHLHLKLSVTLKNALFMTLKNPIISLLLALIHMIIIIVSFKLLPFLIPFFIGSFISIISFITFYTISLRLPTT